MKPQTPQTPNQVSQVINKCLEKASFGDTSHWETLSSLERSLICSSMGTHDMGLMTPRKNHRTLAILLRFSWTLQVNVSRSPSTELRSMLLAVQEMA